MLLSSLQYKMQQTLIFLLKYGSTDFSVYNDGTSIVWRKDLHAIPPLAAPLCAQYGMKEEGNCKYWNRGSLVRWWTHERHKQRKFERKHPNFEFII